MTSLTSVQKQILNDISKYEPAWRGFGITGNQGFGNLMDETIDRITILETSSSQSALEFNVTFNSLNEIFLLENNIGLFLSEIIIKVIEPFNNLSKISIGTDLDQELLMRITESDLNEINEYIALPKTTVSDSIKLFLDTAGAINGQAKVIIKF